MIRLDRDNGFFEAPVLRDFFFFAESLGLVR